MKKELYDKLFAQLDSLDAIRRHEVYLGPDEAPGIDIEEPLLSDCVQAFYHRDKFYYYNGDSKNLELYEDAHIFFCNWQYDIPSLRDQSDSVGEKLFELLS